MKLAKIALIALSLLTAQSATAGLSSYFNLFGWFKSKSFQEEIAADLKECAQRVDRGIKLEKLARISQINDEYENIGKIRKITRQEINELRMAERTFEQDQKLEKLLNEEYTMYDYQFFIAQRQWKLARITYRFEHFDEFGWVFIKPALENAQKEAGVQPMSWKEDVVQRLAAIDIHERSKTAQQRKDELEAWQIKEKRKKYTLSDQSMLLYGILLAKKGADR